MMSILMIIGLIHNIACDTTNSKLLINVVKCLFSIFAQYGICLPPHTLSKEDLSSGYQSWSFRPTVDF